MNTGALHRRELEAFMDASDGASLDAATALLDDIEPPEDDPSVDHSPVTEE